MNTTLIPTIVGLTLLASALPFSGCDPEPAGTDDQLYEQDYPDGWVSDFPDEIDGYTVLYIRTPRTQACIDTSILDLVMLPGAKPVSEDVRSAVDDLEDSIPILGGVTIINVEPPGTTRAELDEAVRVWNKAAQSLGCDGVGWSAGRLKLPDSS